MSKYQVAYGGVPAHAVAGGVLVGTLSHGGPPGSVLAVSYAPAPDEKPICVGITVKTGWRCERPALGGKDRCLGHQKQLEKTLAKEQ